MLELSQSLQVEKVGIEWWKPFQGHAGARSVHFELQEAVVWDFPDGPVAKPLYYQWGPVWSLVRN